MFHQKLSMWQCGNRPFLYPRGWRWIILPEPVIFLDDFPQDKTWSLDPKNNLRTHESNHGQLLKHPGDPWVTWWEISITSYEPPLAPWVVYPSEIRKKKTHLSAWALEAPAHTISAWCRWTIQRCRAIGPRNNSKCVGNCQKLSTMLILEPGGTRF